MMAPIYFRENNAFALCCQAELIQKSNELQAEYTHKSFING